MVSLLINIEFFFTSLKQNPIKFPLKYGVLELFYRLHIIYYYLMINKQKC